MKRKRPLAHALLALACLSVGGIAADPLAPAAPQGPAVPAPTVDVQIQIQGRGQIQFNAGGVQVHGIAGATTLAAQKATQLGQPPMIFIPGFPFHPLPNVAAATNAKPGFLGVTLETAADDGDGKKNPGVGVLSIIDDSPAAKAGLKEGDRVLTFEGKKATDFTQLREMIRATGAEKAVKLTVRRDGKDVNLKAKLGAAPDDAVALQMFGGGMLLGQNAPEAVPGVVVFRDNSIRGFAVAGKTGTAGASGSSSGSTPADKDSVSLRDGNVFTGKITGIDPEKGVSLKREGLPDLDLIEDEITGLTFADREKTAPSPAKVHLQLRDGSWFGGDALTMEHGKIVLTLPGGQRLEIPREHVQSATLSNEEAPQIYDGPMGLAGWTTGRSQGQWEYKDGFLRCISNGPITRNFERMPDPLDLSFDVIYPPMMQHFGITLFGAGVNQSGAGTLSLQFSPNQIYGNHYDGRRSNAYNVPLKQPGFDAKPQAIHYRLLVDRVNGKALIYINSTKHADWKLSKVKAADIGKCGATFRFSPNVYSSNNQMQLGRIRLLPWDGKEPANGAEPADVKSDQVLAGDGTVLNGAIEKITGEEIVLANPARAARRDGTLYVRFAAPAASEEQAAAVALVRLKNGSEFAATQVTDSGGRMTFATRFGSQVTLPLSALSELSFLPRPGYADSAATGIDVLTLTDGTQLKGNVLAPLDGEKLAWKIAASKTPLEFPNARVAGILFSQAKGEREAAALNGSSAVRLGNGDWLPGDVVSIDGKQLVMKTDLTPGLIVPLTDLRALYLSPDVAASVSDGATGSGLWSNGWNPNRTSMSKQQADALSKTEPPWMYHDGGYAPTGAARNGMAVLARKWPAYAGAFAVNLEMTNPGRSASFHIQLFNSKDERTFTIYCIGGRVNVYFNPSNARLNRFAGGGKRFETDAKAESAGGNMRVSIVLDRPAKTFRVFIAGKEIGKIPFKEDEAAEALDIGGISLSPMSSGLVNGRPHRIARIWLAPWEGTQAAASAPAEKKEDGTAGAEPKKDSAPMPTIYLVNGDECAGTIEKFSAGLMTLNSDAGPLELPAKRVAWISFPGSASNEGKHFPHLRFHDSGLLSVNVLHIENGRVKCKTMQGQALEFPLSLVKEVDWHPLDEK